MTMSVPRSSLHRMQSLLEDQQHNFATRTNLFPSYCINSQAQPGFYLSRAMLENSRHSERQFSNPLTTAGCVGDPLIILLLAAFKNTCLLISSLFLRLIFLFSHFLFLSAPSFIIFMLWHCSDKQRYVKFDFFFFFFFFMVTTTGLSTSFQ